MTYTYNQGSFTCNKPELFMAVCKYKDHSYMIVGVKDSETQEQLVLATFGRKGFFGTSLSTEYMPKKSESLIEMQAFTISINQYANLIQFLAKMKKNQRSNAAIFAVPSTWIEAVQESGEQVHFTWLNYDKKIETLSEPRSDQANDSGYDPDKIKQGISLDTNCRTTAKYITQTTMGVDSLPNVSSLFFTSLPFKAKLCDGKIKEKLFIYPPPLPVHQNPEDKAQWDILKKMYARMDKIAKSASGKNMDSSHEKFDLIKTLYQEQYNKLTQGKQSINDLLGDIQRYISEGANATIIDRPRRFAFFKTSTRKMFEQIQKENPFQDDASKVNS
ncbi:hypothetical protein [Legionella cherrii]|uniref:Dot/Icm T4SS effector n=1 Tax=Legionella cherrii TaxID=28084 RepID=A0ABY6T8V2_9GAMM|nr:hypothetical protein [Legionella cherrii]VEB38213.1 Uncharacterised protein [Legionella cherrii]